MYSETNWHRSHLHDWENKPSLLIACKSSPCCSAPAATKINNYTLQNNSYSAPPSVRKLYFISLVLKLRAQLISARRGPSLLPPASVQSHISVWLHALKSCLKAIIFFFTVEYTAFPRKMSYNKVFASIPIKSNSQHLPVQSISIFLLLFSLLDTFVFLYFKILTK